MMFKHLPHKLSEEVPPQVFHGDRAVAGEFLIELALAEIRTSASFNFPFELEDLVKTQKILR